MEEPDGNEIQCQCGQYHTDKENKLGVIRYSTQHDGETIELGTLYTRPDCELMPGLNIDWSALLNPMTARGSLFECLFEVVDCGGQHELTELAVPRARVDSGAEPTLDGRKGGLGHPALAV